MHEPEPTLRLTPDLRGWTQILAGYREPSTARSILEIVITVLPLMFLWLLMWASLTSATGFACCFRCQRLVFSCASS